MRTICVSIITVALLAGSAIDVVGQSETETGPGTAATVDELFSVTLDEAAIPEDLAGILFFNKLYPTDMDITYGPGFVPPNTFVRYVETGELGVRPNSEIVVMRAGADATDAEVLAAGEEAVVAPGDTFVMTDIPYDEYGLEALGEMWTPAEDAEVVGFAIRETSRCCSMSHAGMISPWYVTLSGSAVDEMRGQPVTLRVLRWDVSPGDSLPLSAETGAMLRFVEEGIVTASKVTGEAASSSDEEPFTVEYKAGATIYPLSLDAGQMVAFSNAGDESAVVYELRVEPARDAS